MDRWEYKAVVIDRHNLEAELEPLGKDGWEAVGFVVAMYDAQQSMPYAAPPVVSQWDASYVQVLLKKRAA